MNTYSKAASEATVGDSGLVAWIALSITLGLTFYIVIKGLPADVGSLVAYSVDGCLRAVRRLLTEYQPASVYFWGPIFAIVAAEKLVVFLTSKFRSHMGSVYAFHFDFLTVQSLRALPLWLQVVIVVLASDLLSWFSHWLKHKVKFLWHFHSIHHSQRELNAFTDHRVHPIEKMVSVAIRFLPMTLLELKHGVALGITWWFFTTWHTMIYHANIRTNYGWLRYIFVTPQSHRVHHSRVPEHQDKNFGTIFSVWDFLFGTQYRDYDVYPEVGVEDDDQPIEYSRNPLIAIKTFGAQLVYPFKLIFRNGI